MKKRDKFWFKRIFYIFAAVIIFILVSFYNILQFNGSYFLGEKADLETFRKQIVWAITPILKNNDTELLQKYCNDFKDDKEFSFRIFDKDNNFIAGSITNKNSEIAKNDTRLNKAKQDLWELYRHSFKDKDIEQVTELNFGNSKYYLEISVSSKFVVDSIIKAQKNIIVLFVVCLIFLILSIVQIFFSIRKSFNALEDSVLEISKGKLDTKINVINNGLLEELTLAIIKMTCRLKNQIERLSKLEQYKTDFIQNITHEIKTPITVMNSAIELIKTKDSVNSCDKECLEIVKFQNETINKLVNDILKLAETDLKKTEEIKNFKQVNLFKAVSEAVKQQGIVDCSIEIIKENDITLNANYALLVTMISNLLSNAIKYSKSEKIEVILKKENNIQTLTVKDYGIGIEKEYLPKIFEKFYRVDKSRSKALGGTGLGLSIVKNIVELHNWKITVDSEINRFTSFKIYFENV